MNSSIQEMLKKYPVVNQEEEKNAIKEIIQEIALCGLSRAGFFNRAAFYGGTALRIFYGLNRFSEDLDFSLMDKDPTFQLSDYFRGLQNEANSYGLKLDISEKNKSADSNIKSAFLKGNTKEHLLMFYPNSEIGQSINKNEIIKIKFEIDTDPPKGAGYENRYQLLPAPYQIRLYDMPSLFAGKIHAVLCRSWKNRVKGRDLYDYIFYLSRGAFVNMEHLRARLIDSGALKESDSFDIDILKSMLCTHFDSMDFDDAKNDVRGFIYDKDSLNLWSADFFKQITEGLNPQCEKKENRYY